MQGVGQVERGGGYESPLTDSTPAISMKGAAGGPWHFHLSYRDRRNLNVKVLDFVKSGGLHRHEHDGWPRRSGSILQWTRDSRAVDQGGQVRAELDSAVLPSVRGQSGASVSVHPGLQPGELPAPVMSAQGGQALVAAERPGQADQDGRSAGAPLPVVDLSVVRGVGSSTVVRGSAGSYRPVIAGAKLREDATTILPRGRALQGVALSPMRFHPTGRGHEDDEDGQEGCSTTANASLVG